MRFGDDSQPRLGGEANPTSWHFAAQHGPLPNPIGHTFPILSHDRAGLWRLIGTGFYISSDGLFVTARHVIRDVLNGEKQVSPLVILHLWSESGLFGPQQFLLRPVTQCWISDSSDVALGVAAQSSDSRGVPLAQWCWSLDWESPSVGSPCATYAFPNHSIAETPTVQVIRILPDLYDGEILKVADYRDSVMVPHPYLEVSARIHHAASGGPVAIPGKGVVGINCSYLDPDGPGVATQIRCLQDAFLDHVVLGSETVGRRVGFCELVAAGVVTARGYKDWAAPIGSGHVVRLELAPSSTRRLVIETTISS